MLPVIKAIGMAFNAFSAASTIKNLASDSTSGTASKKETSMNSIQDAAGAPAAGTSAAAAPSAGEAQDRFLKLLVTQMKNQDPLNPLDNAQVTTQLAQISTVSGIEKLNSSLQNLSTSFLAGQSLQSAALIGRQVLTGGSSIAYIGSPAAAGAQLEQAADRVTVMIAGPAGNIVRRLELGPQEAGAVRFEWDGKDENGASVPSGAYKFRVDARSNGQPVAAAPLSLGRVNSVSFGSEGLRVEVDGVGPIQLGDIQRIL